MTAGEGPVIAAAALGEVSEAAKDADIGQPTLVQRSIAEIKKGHLRGGPEAP